MITVVDNGDPMGHPLNDHRRPLGAAIADAIDGASGLNRSPVTIAEFDQHQKACADVQALVLWFIEDEQDAARRALSEAQKR